MADVLIRGLSDEVVAALDMRAARLGLSRAEYIRRRLAQDIAFPTMVVEVADLHHFAADFADLADADVLSKAWE